MPDDGLNPWIFYAVAGCGAVAAVLALYTGDYRSAAVLSVLGLANYLIAMIADRQKGMKG